MRSRTETIDLAALEALKILRGDGYYVSGDYRYKKFKRAIEDFIMESGMNGSISAEK